MDAAEPPAEESLQARVRELFEACTTLARRGDMDALLRRIVQDCQVLTNADGCTYYEVRDGQLHFQMVLSASLGIVRDAGGQGRAQIPPIAIHLPDGRVDPTSLAAQCAAGGRLLNIPDVSVTPGYPDSRTRLFDQRMGYVTRSMLNVPVNFDGQTVGVLQLINAKNGSGEEIPFGPTHEQIAISLASLIALAYGFGAPA